MQQEKTKRRTGGKLVGRLTDAQIRNLETKEKAHKVTDGNSLYLIVFPTGLRSWRFKYYSAGAEQSLTIGSYPAVSLAAARKARDEARSKLLVGIDPVQERRQAKRAAMVARENSFESVARAWHATWSKNRHQRYAEDVMSRFERNVFPMIGRKPISQLEPVDVVRVMESMRGSLRGDGRR